MPSKKRVLIAGLIVVGCVGLVLLASLFANRPNKVWFESLSSEPQGPFTFQNYAWYTPVPFQGGKVWLMASVNRTNHAVYLYDLKKMKITGQLHGEAMGIFMNGNGTKAFCQGPTTTATSWKGQIAGALNQKLGLSIETNRVEALWVVDLRTNKARRIGQFEQAPGMGSIWLPAPGFRYGYTQPTTARTGKEFVLVDLEREKLEMVACDGDPQGWWDERTMLLRDKAKNLFLFDVETRAKKVIIHFKEIQQALIRYGVRDDPLWLWATPSWNGNGYDFYFVLQKGYRDPDYKGIVLKLDRESLKLILLDRSQREHLGTFNESGTLYGYNGEDGSRGAGGNGAVIIRSVADGSERVLVPPDNKGRYPFPRFYEDSIIFFRDGAVWRCNVQDSKAKPVRLLPEENSNAN